MSDNIMRFSVNAGVPPLVLPPNLPESPLDRFIPRASGPRYGRFWFYTWHFAKGEVVKGSVVAPTPYVSNDPTEMETALTAEQVKGKGFGVLLDGHTGRIVYFLTGQVSKGEAEKVCMRYFEEMARKNVKVGERAEFNGIRYVRRHVKTGAWDAWRA